MNCFQEKQIWINSKPYIVPCGKCLACLTTKREDWSNRLLQEWRASKGALFITLTYHPKFLPEDGVCKRHVQLYLKRLRKNVKGKIRYYAVGEYGTKTSRAHYHILLFTGNCNEARVRNSWTINGKEIGLVHVGKVTEASVRYCTKYVIQRNSEDQIKIQRNKPFALMSRAYGLGGAYLTDEMVKWHREGKRNWMIIHGIKHRLPRYYKEKIWYKAKSKNLEDVGDYLQQVIYQHKDRELVSQMALEEKLKAEKENYDILKKRGYIPELIIAEMRNAVLSQVHEKVAFTQKF